MLIVRALSIVLVAFGAVTYIHNDRRGSKAEGSEITFEEVARFGELESADETQLFGGPQQLGVDSAGFFYLRDHPRVDVRLYDANRQHVRDIGLRGRGPGEIAKPTTFVVRPSGGVAVADALNRKIIEYSREGELIREEQLPESSIVHPSYLLPIGGQFVAFYSMPTVSQAQEVLHLYSNTFDAKIESFAPSQEIWDPDDAGQHAIAGNPKGATASVWNDSICIASAIYDGVINCYHREATGWTRLALTGDEVNRAYEMMPESTSFGDRCCWSISGPGGRAIIRVLSSSRGFATHGDDLLHFSVRLVEGKHRLYVERFDLRGKLVDSGRVGNYPPFEKDESAVFHVLASTADDHVYVTDMREGYPVIRDVLVHFN